MFPNLAISTEKVDTEKDFTIYPNKLSGRIAFSAKISGKYQLFVLDLDSNKVRKLVVGPGANWYPSWSPDGRKVAFVSDRDGNPEIYIANWDGSNQVRITKNKVIDKDPSWHPKGYKIIFAHQEEQNKKIMNLFEYDLKTKKIKRVTKFKGRNTTPRYSPDGKKIAYSTDRFWPGWDVCVWNIEAKSESCIFKGAITFCRPAWSPYSPKVMASYGVAKNIDLIVYDPEKKQRYRVSDMPLREYDVVYGHDKKHIAFTAENGQEEHFSLWIMSKPFKPKKLLDSHYSIRYISWSPVTTLTLEVERLKKKEKEKNLKPLLSSSSETLSASSEKSYSSK